jgi:hypothetical protein
MSLITRGGRWQPHTHSLTHCGYSTVILNITQELAVILDIAMYVYIHQKQAVNMKRTARISTSGRGCVCDLKLCASCIRHVYTHPGKVVRIMHIYICVYMRKRLWAWCKWQWYIHEEEAMNMIQVTYVYTWGRGYAHDACDKRGGLCVHRNHSLVQFCPNL